MASMRIGPKIDLRISRGVYGIAGAIFGLLFPFSFGALADGEEGGSILAWATVFALVVTGTVGALGAMNRNQDPARTAKFSLRQIASMKNWAANRLREWLALKSRQQQVEPNEILVTTPTGSRNVIRWTMLWVGVALGANEAYSQGCAFTGSAYLYLRESGLSHELARSFTRTSWVQELSTSLAAGIPLFLWLLVSRWEPRTRTGYACRFGLWPIVFLSGQLGGPIACAVLDVKHDGNSFSMLAKGLPCLAIVIGPIFAFIGYGLGAGIGSPRIRQDLTKARNVQALSKSRLGSAGRIPATWRWSDLVGTLAVQLPIAFVLIVVLMSVGKTIGRLVGYGTQTAFEQLEQTSVSGSAPSSHTVKVLASSEGFAPNVTSQTQPYADGIEAYAVLTRAQAEGLGFQILSESKPSKLEVTFEYRGAINGKLFHCYAKAVQKGESIRLTTAVATKRQWPMVASELKACVDSFDPD